MHEEEFNGVLHIHGALDRNPERTSDLIISDQDFGEFYLRRRIVPDLIYDAARLYNLVLVGYRANDPPMKYLLDAVAAVFPLSLNARDQATMRSMIEFLEGRFEKKETIEWALRHSPHDSLKRWAILHLLNTPEGMNLREPWRSAWRLIEESWDETIADSAGRLEVNVKRRLQSGERSGALISAIVDLVAPKLTVGAYSTDVTQPLYILRIIEAFCPKILGQKLSS